MNAQQAGLMQMQLRHNAEDLQGYLKDLQSWEEEIKEKDRNLSKQKPILKEVQLIYDVATLGVGYVCCY